MDARLKLPLSDIQIGSIAPLRPATYEAGAEDHLSLEAAFAIGSNLPREFVESGGGSMGSIAAVWSLLQESNFNSTCTDDHLIFGDTR